MPNNPIISEFNGNGASAQTAMQDGLPPGPASSSRMAQTDLPRVQPLKQLFTDVGESLNLPPALLAAIASRESRGGAALDRNGFGDFGNAFGIMQVDKRFNAPLAGLPDPTSEPHINQAAGILGHYFTQMIAKFPGASAVRQLQAAVAAYNCGVENVASPDTADAYTTGHDYSNDVWERASFFATGW